MQTQHHIWREYYEEKRRFNETYLSIPNEDLYGRREELRVLREEAEQEDRERQDMADYLDRHERDTGGVKTKQEVYLDEWIKLSDYLSYGTFLSWGERCRGIDILKELEDLMEEETDITGVTVCEYHTEFDPSPYDKHTYHVPNLKKLKESLEGAKE